MKVIYENTEINVQVSECIIVDNMGGKADSLAITFADIKNECRKWEFKKNHVVEVIEPPFSTGKMYVDEFGCGPGTYTLRALSTRKKFKTKFTRTWENVRFLALANDLLKEEGLKLETYGVIQNYEYTRVDQIEKNNIDFLNERCILEGYNLKICDEKAVIIAETFLEQQKENVYFNPSMFVGKYEFKCTSKYIYSGCEISYNSRKYIKGIYISNNNGELLKLRNIEVSNSYEADRFAKNILKFHNKYERMGTFYLNKNTNIAAGITVKIQGLDLFDGKYIIERVYQELIQGKTKVTVRKVLEEFL